MGDSTAISWTHRTFNPWWGCVKVSPACDSCYAERDAHRYGFADGGGNGPELWGPGSERRQLSDKNWAKPLRWEAEAVAGGYTDLVFCASMADVFEARDDLDPWRARLWELIEATPHLVWQVLTKRPEQVLRRIPPRWLGVTGLAAEPGYWEHASVAERRDWACRPEAAEAWPKNVWIGTTVENQRYADLRLPRLLEVPAPVRWLSVEPMLGPVNLSRWISSCDCLIPWTDGDGQHSPTCSIFRPSIDWVIVGGESGPGHRPLDLDHARTLRSDCAGAGVPFFFKQVGGTRPTDGGNLLDGELIHEFPAELVLPPALTATATPVELR